MKMHLGSFTLALSVLTLIVAIVMTLFTIPNTPVPWVLVAVLVVLPYVHKKLVARRFLSWDDRYNVGIAAIDDDHRRLLNLVNQFQTAVDYSTGGHFEQEALDALVDYTKTHFAREEQLMDQYGYPDAENHKRQHREMIDKVEALSATYRQDPDRSLEEALAFLKKWLMDHIGGTDQQYAGFFRDKGVG